jgi:hypothetical protein
MTVDDKRKQQVPSELNWVKAIASCDAGKVFDEICVDVRKDAEEINKASKLGEYELFRADMLSNASVMVVGQPMRQPRKVVHIVLEGNSIKALDNSSETILQVVVAINDEGRCALKSGDGKELEQWQFRKLALEKLFFASGR